MKAVVVFEEPIREPDTLYLGTYILNATKRGQDFS